MLSFGTLDTGVAYFGQFLHTQVSWRSYRYTLKILVVNDDVQVFCKLVCTSEIKNDEIGYVVCVSMWHLHHAISNCKN